MVKKKSESVVDLSRYDYTRTRIRDTSGKVRHSTGVDDAVARALLIHTAGGGKLGTVIRDNGLTAKYKGREDSNPGLLRMSVGGSLRALVNAGTPVKIGAITVKTLKQTVALPKVEDAAPSGGKAKKAKGRKVKTKKAAPRKRKTAEPAPQPETEQADAA